jgi:quinol monooxygenase YgiN
MIALVVSLHVHEHKLDDFLVAIATNARATFTDEAGCRYFDVVQDTRDPHHFVFYELYDDEAAVEAHRAAPHFAEWRRAARECVVPGSQVNTLAHRKIHHGPPADSL